MNEIQLATTGRRTTQLGFGCSSLMGAIGRKESLALLEHAYDAGIRHIDVAPMYGYGAAEGCVGEFLARHPGEITVATKYGIPPPANPGMMQMARRAVGPVLKLLPGVKKRLAGAAKSVTATAPRASFTAAEARASLQHSLTELRVPRIDIWLLHEAEADHLTDDGLLRQMQEAVASGQVGAFGAGSSADKIPALLTHRPEFCSVLQFEWSILDKPVQELQAFTMHHRALTANFADLSAALQKNVPVRERWSSQVGADLGEPGKLAALMLKAALISNPQSVILVSSRNPGHIRKNVAVAADDSLTEPARKLFAVAQSEGASVLYRS